jgi:tetratricopeptide (TPR) repeat protein
LVGRVRFLLPLALLVVAARAGVVAQTPAPRIAPNAAAEQRLLDAARRQPDRFDAQYQLASFYLQQGKLQEALPYLRRARAIDPADYASGHDLALALLELKQLDEARTLILQMIAAHDTAELHNLLANVSERGGNLLAAAEEYQRAAHMDPTEEHLFDWGDNLLQLHAYDEAAQVFTAGLERHPDSARLHVGLGIAQYSRGAHEQAVTSFCRAADLAPSDPRPYQFLGEMYGVVPSLAGEITERLARFAKAHPRNGLAQYHYAMSLWKGQQTPPADLRPVETLLRRAVTLDRTLTKGFLELGILLSDSQRYAEAIQQLRAAARLEPDLAQAHYRLAQAYQRSGQQALADKELEIFERLSPRTPDERADR